MAKRASKKVEQPGSPGFFLRIPQKILDELEPLVKHPGTKQTVIISILAEHFGINDELPKRGGQKKIRNSVE